MKKNIDKNITIIRFNELLISNEEIGIMLHEITNEVRKKDSQIKFNKYKSGIWNKIKKIINAMDKGGRFEILPENLN